MKSPRTLRAHARHIEHDTNERVRAYAPLPTSDQRRVQAARVALRAYHAAEALRSLADALDALDAYNETEACSDCFLGGATQRRETFTHLCDSCYAQHVQVAKARREVAS